MSLLLKDWLEEFINVLFSQGHRDSLLIIKDGLLLT